MSSTATTTARPWVCTEPSRSYAGQTQRALHTHLRRAHDIRTGEAGSSDPNALTPLSVQHSIVETVRGVRELTGSTEEQARAAFIADKAVLVARIEAGEHDPQHCAVTGQR